ncbi:MAG TPA: polyphosphate kinase 1 [Solirubrobacterales bacterium]|nr:polyphosphate kinase 1 [Solirubrobacterales bacterium]
MSELGIEREATAANGALASAGTPPAPAPEPVDLEDSWLYFNRELSWMDFNDRVLQLAEDASVPLLERLKFGAIYESNLDEFYMVRVAGVHDKIVASLTAGGADGIPPVEVLAAIRERAIAQRARLERCLAGELLPALGERGIRILKHADATPGELAEIDALFSERVFPALTPLVFGVGRPFPYISNLSLSLLVALRDPVQDTEVMARVKVPKELMRRYLPIGDGNSFVPLEDVISHNLEALFPGMEVLGHALFRVTRDTDYDVSDEADDVRRAVEEEIRRRRFGEVVRLELQGELEPRLRERLVSLLGIGADQVYEVGWIGMDDLLDIAGVAGFDHLRYPPFSPVTQTRLQAPEGQTPDLLAAIREGDILVHHPYDSFQTSVEAFVDQAVNDPDVLAIKQTVYRTSDDSPLVPALITASELGKQAVCMVELKARFDEQANIRWAKKLEQAGVHVVYGIPALKTHAKCILIARREGDGVRHYAHIGTVNYNPKTARLYTDLGIFTADPEVCSDIAEMFNYLTGYARPQNYRKALIAPFNLSEGLLEEIDRTVAAHSPERPARIRMKMNSLLDQRTIQALYRAAQAGVEVQLNVRGICALRPGVEGVSDRISVVSVLGRFLEHSRIYCFERPGETTIYTGSADLMPRNLYNRVELVIPVEDEAVKQELLTILDLSLGDDSGAWKLDAEGEWTRQRPAPGAAVRDVQAALIERSTARAAEALQTI